MAKGWLDNYGKQENYNDSKTSVPQGFVGEGYNTKGRNYSPAWGGQFQDGGAIYVSSENDPRYKSYADSLYNYNLGNKLKGVAKSIPSLVEIKKGSPYDKALQKTLMKSKNRGLVDNTKNPNSKSIDPRIQALMKEYQKKANKGIKPIRYNSFIDDPDNGAIDLITGRGFTDLIGLTKERSKGYNLPEWKKPKQKVVVKPETKKSSDTPVYNPSEKRWEVEGTLKPQPKQKVKVVQPDLLRVEAINLPPMQQLQSIDPPAISDVVRSPKSYNVSAQRYHMQGPSDYYNYNQEGVDYERAMQIKAASDAYNKNILKRYGPQNEYRTPKSAKDAAERLKQLRSEFEMTPNYQMGGSVYPVNYVPEAQMGASIPGAVGFSYARTNDPAPSNGPYAKKTMASAQNGNKTKKKMAQLDLSKLNLTIPKSSGYAWADNKIKNNADFAKKLKTTITNIDNKKIAAIKKQYKVDDATAKKWYANSKNSNQEQNEIRQYTPQSTLSKTWEVLANPMTAFGYAARNQDLPDNFSRGEKSILDIPTDIINPAAWLNYGAKGLSDFSDVPGQLIEGDFTGAGESAFSGTMNLLGAFPLGQEIKPFIPAALKTLPKAKSVRDALGTFRGIPTERSLPRLAPEELKIYRQVQDVGRLRATRKPISEQYKYALDQNIPEEHLQKIFGKTKAEIENIVGAGPTEQELRIAENNARRERLVAENQAEEAGDMFQAMPESLRARVQAIDARRAAQMPPTSLDDVFAQLDAGTHSSQTSGDIFAGDLERMGVSQPIASGSRSQDIARAMERDRLRQMMGTLDDQGNVYNQRPIGGVDDEAMNAVINYSDDADDLIINYGDELPEGYEGDTSGPPMPYDKERDYLQRYLSGQTNKVEDYANRTLYPKINTATEALDQFGRTANRVTESQVSKFENKLGQIISEYPYYEGPVLQNVPLLTLTGSGSLKNVSNQVGKQSFSGIGPGDVFTGSLNTSHSSYLPQLKQVFKYNEGTPQFFGYQPMNSMGFLSDFGYSSEDIAKYLNTEIDDQIRRGIVPDNILRPYSTNRRNVRHQSVQLPHYGIKQNPLTHREGGVIKDDRGQWAYPGEVTEIGSNRITMQGVPYPVLGVSDTGDTQMMYPGEEYEYDGEKVTEYPMAKNGIRQEQKGLVNLDQLTNFTNYNTKQPGGWLDKY